MRWKGQTLIELILIMGIASIMLPALLTGLFASRSGKPQQEARMQAISVLKETETAVKSIRRSDWSAFSLNGTYHTEISGSQWSLVSDSFTNSKGITQEIVISDVLRDEGGAIVTTGGIVDPSTKKVEIVISWTRPYTSSINSTLYVTRYSNETFTQTTLSDFNAGTASRSAILATGGSATDGHIELATGSGGGGSGGSQPGGRPLSDWCEPNLSITALDLPKNGVANAISAIQGRVFAGTGENSSGVSFANVNVTDTDPPVSSTLGTFNGYKTNDVFGETNYAYIGTDNNAKEIGIINLSSSPYTEAGYFNAPGNGNGNSVYVSGNIGYMTSGNRMYNFNLSSKSGSRPIIDSDGVLLSGSGTSITVQGNYAYVSTNGAYQFQIIDISNSSNLRVVGQITLSGGAGKDVVINSTSTRAYLVTWASSQKEFFIIDIEDKNDPELVTGGDYDTNSMSPNGVTIITQHNIALIVGSGGEEYQVVDIENENSPTRCGGLNIDTGVRGISSVEEADGDAYSYIITGDASAELKIIEGGPGGQIPVDANWCSPQYAVVETMTLPRTGNVLTAQQGEAFVGSGNGTAGVSFADVSVTTPQANASPSATLIGTFSGSQQTNDVYSDGNYAYVAINGSSSQVLILNISSSPFTQVGTITLPSNTNANGVFVSGNVAYVTSSNKLYSFDVTNKNGSHTTVLGQIDLYSGGGATPTAKNVKVIGGKAFVSATNTAYGLQVFLISSGGSSFRLVGVSDLSFQQSATGLSVNSSGSRAFVSYNNGTGSVPRGFYIVDTSVADPPVWWPVHNFYSILGNYNSGDTDPKGITLASGATNRAILVGTGGTYQYQAIDISLEGDPIRCGGLELPSGIAGVASANDQFDKHYAYIISQEGSEQFKVIAGGNGGGDYWEDGTFESSIFESSTANTAFNRFSATVSRPTQTTLRMQVASSPRVSGSCANATYTFVGPDGSTTSFFTPSGSSIASPIPFGNYSPSFENPAQCFKYKTWFTTWNTSQTPALNDVTVNYSP
jgi:type II secretory pathway pseudopilin PulG